MADMRRRSPEPPPGPPQIQLQPGMAQELLRELAPLLAEEGIDVDNIDVPDVQTLQRALNRAMERHNMSLFTPVGRARELAAATLRLAVEAIADSDTPLAATVLDQAQPESPDGSAPTVAACTGLALGLLDQWLTRHDTDALAGLAACEQGRRVRYITTAQLVNELVEAADDRVLSRLVGRYSRLDLLLLDELGYVQVDPRGAELLFQIITEREERASIAIGTNLPFSEWGTVFPDPRLVAAIVDRVTYNAHILETGTHSYRLRTSKTTSRGHKTS